MNLSKREKYILILTATVIMSAVAYNFIIAPVYRSWRDAGGEIILKEIKLKKTTRLLKNRSYIINEYNTYASSINNASKLLGYIEKKAISLGVKIANIKPRPLKQKDFYKEYVIELQIEGKFSSINRFVSELISSPAFITVEKFDFRTKQGAPSFLKGALILSKFII